MWNTGRRTRRTVLKLLGSSGVLAFLAGCADEGGDGDNGEDATDDDDENGTDADGEDGADDAGGELDWAEADEIYLEGRATGWTVIEPAELEGEENPTLPLIEGETYDFRWVNGDGAPHNIEMRDGEEGDVVGDYSTEIMDEEGEEQTLEGVEITDEMGAYYCQVHPDTQWGEIDVQ